uniref:membrane protein FAM174B-like n=1 Tax=Pristiophorus japonicus TaxID=55135 RepID=UPI00398E911B
MGRWRLCALAVPLLLLPAVLCIQRGPTAGPAPLNRTAAPAAPGNGTATATATSLGSVTSILRYLPALKSLVLAACVGAFLLIVCLLVRMMRSGRKLRKTRKYDIITTPAEKVEMTPLNEDNDDDEDATVFDV